MTFRHVYLLPGSFHCAPDPTILTTVLGSCVAVCLWDRDLGIGGMNHYVLPGDGESSGSTRFGDASIRALLIGMIRLGSRLENLAAKVFGGAAVLPYGADRETVGAKNVRIAFMVLERYGIPIVAHRTGGERGVRLQMQTSSGGVLLRWLEGSSAGSRIIVRARE